MNARAFVAGAMLMLSMSALACGSDDDGGTGPAASQSICFSVSGFNVTVSNMWKGGGSYSTNVQGLASFSQTVSQNNESHSLQWSSIQNNYTTFTVTSFNVTIDGKAYSYPANKC